MGVVAVIVLVALALATALVSGSNDGATLVALNTRTTTIAPLRAVIVLAFFVAVGPMIVGTAVASTVARGLVAFEKAGGELAFIVAIACALIIVFGLSHRGLPTSVTLAITGSIVGAGIGFALPVHWGVVVAVLLAGVVAPLSAALVAYVVTDIEQRLRPPELPRRFRKAAEWFGFLLQSFAYGTNDAEKLVAILALALGIAHGVRISIAGQIGVAILFIPGILLSVRQVAARVAERITHVRSDTAIAVTVCAAGVVLLSSLLGYPISSTQAATAALVGVGVRTAPRQVQWPQIGRIGVAWLVTLPLAIATAAMVGLVVRFVR
ncbi:MAG: inorganic phosphate transporter [Ferrimicrobium sp.]|jgi:PiT family inorganic phosphate transporter|nr:inorganic phosphate transporter [Ferrimicrobium sp.]